MNVTSVRRLNNNANDTFNDIAGESFSDTANQEFSQTFATTRQTRFSERGAKVALESLDSIDELSQTQLREQQQHEINRIIDDSSNETLEQFHHANKAAMTQVYKQLFVLIHSDKQSEE